MPNFSRLQNSPYFCVFKYAPAVKQKVWNEVENRERNWGETLKTRVFFLSPHTPVGRVRLTRLARVRLLRHALPMSLLILRKNRLFYARTFDKGLTPVHTLIKNFKLTKIPSAERIEDTNLVLDVYPGGGVIPGKSWWGLLPDPISDKKNVILHILFSDLASKI